LKRDNFYASLWKKQNGFTFNVEGYARVSPDRLRSIPIFGQLDLAVIKELSEYFLTETFEPGTLVITEGAKGDKFNIAVRGRLQVLKKGPDGVNQAVAVLEDGDHFGEIALLKSVPRTASILAISHTSCLSLSHEHFMKLVESQPDLMGTLEDAMNARHQETSQVIAPVGQAASGSEQMDVGPPLVPTPQDPVSFR